MDAASEPDPNNKLKQKVVYRFANHLDVPQMMAILNREIDEDVNCFRTKPMTAYDQAQWWRARENGRYPAWVALVNNEVVGWSSISRWSSYEAYDATVEISIWLSPEFHRMGIGSNLFSSAIQHARESGFRVILSRIESENAASIALHTRFGFTVVGTTHRVGEKFGRILDVVIMELLLDQPNT